MGTTRPTPSSPHIINYDYPQPSHYLCALIASDVTDIDVKVGGAEGRKTDSYTEQQELSCPSSNPFFPVVPD